MEALAHAYRLSRLELRHELAAASCRADSAFVDAILASFDADGTGPMATQSAAAKHFCC